MLLGLFQIHLKKGNRTVILGAALVIAITFIVMAFLLLFTPRPAESLVADIRLGQHAFHVTIAQTVAERERGLSGQRSLGVNEGMLFVFPSEGIYPFWMPNMHFPLDILWINHGKIVEIARLQAPSISHPETELHTPTQKADRVVELNAGSVEKFGLHLGDSFAIVQ